MIVVWETIALILITILIFTIIYHFHEQWSWIQSCYTSTMMATLIGKSEPKKDSTKLIMIIQALISFALAGQLIILFAK